MMRTFVETPIVRRARYIFVGALLLALLVTVVGGAELRAWLDSRGPAAVAHTAAYYRVIFSIWATIFLLTPALCFHIFSRSTAANTYWRALWTAAYLAFLAHIWWAVQGICGGDSHVVFHSQVATPAFPECLIEHPRPDFFLAAWWGFDVVLAWLVTDDIKWLRGERGAVHMLAFTMFFGAFVLAAKAGIIAHLLGILMAILVLGSLVVRLIVQENDPKSLIAILYVGFFQVLNLFVPWHRLPTLIAVTNLGALREVLRAKNLHNTSDIAVTEEKGLRDTVPYNPRYLCEREEDGQYNDLTKPTMGNAAQSPNDPLNNTEFTLSNPGARFGRNIPLTEVDPTRDGDILDPSPRLVSNRLLARQKKSDGSYDFKPATILNLLAAAWI